MSDAASKASTAAEADTATGPAAHPDPYDPVELARRGMTLARFARDAPDRPALLSAAGDRTFGELNARANQLARALRRRGVGEGDGVALLCRNRPEWIEVLAATTRAGLRLTPINWHLTGGEAGYIVGDCEAKVLIADARVGPVATEAAAEAPGATVRLVIGGELEGFESYDAALAAEDDTDIDDAIAGSTMQYTSGTTGRPKGVFRPAAAVANRRAEAQTAAAANSAQASIAGYVPGESVHLCTGPAYHAAPLAFSISGPLNAGVTVVLMDGWDPEETLRLIQEHRVSHSHMVPTMFHRLIALSDETKQKYDVSTLKFIIHGAAPCPVPVKQALIDWIGPVVYEYYAATEGMGTLVGSADWLKKPGTVGRSFVPDGIRIYDDEGKQLGADEIGTVYLKAPATARFEYFKDASKTSSAYHPDGYFTLGDVGYLDEDGYLFLTDRSANLIISGGVNIYPAEVDAVLLTHPAVADVATIGVPNPEWGEEVKAVVELKREVGPSPALVEELIAFTRERLSHYKCPKTVDFVDSLPREDTGKIYKRLLRDRYRTAAEQSKS